ncbi:hypothetical protein P6F26_04600 [Roseibacterium sp. SDUM158017]|uniref:hypothetical protein n=1 Tax=Roseicyclus salinarum TaxID=3036773 RepID=UPI002414DB22|nr:hypothetical protein [Roseibacterium sp. SDUM158017]MDG4647713.1 hypothetical protein [Roseibacterium sp. SDUM158017]
MRGICVRRILNEVPGYLRSESGAATSDWVVMSSATVGIGLAVMFVMTPGVERASGEIAETVGAIMTAADAVLARHGFDDGMGPWSGGEIMDVPGFGNMLVLDRNDNRGAIGASARLSIDPDAPYAVVEFDMAFIDSWDNETAQVYLNGEAVAVGTFTHLDHPRFDTGNLPPQMRDLGVVAIDFGEPSTVEGGYFRPGQGSRFVDHVQPVRIVVETNGASELDLGFGTNLNSGYRDESLGIDNIVVSSAQSR